MKIRMMLMMFCVLAMTPMVFAQTTINLFDPVDVTLSPAGTSAANPFTFGETSLFLSCPVGATATLSGPDAGNLIVDNFLTVNGTNVCPDDPNNPFNGSCFSNNFSLNTGGQIEDTFSGVAPIDISSLLITGNNLFTFNLVDAGLIFGSTEINLTTTCSQVYPVCHRNNGKKGQKTIFVGSQNAVNAHVTNHGDTVGPCAGS